MLDNSGPMSVVDSVVDGPSLSAASRANDESETVLSSRNLALEQLLSQLLYSKESHQAVVDPTPEEWRLLLDTGNGALGTQGSSFSSRLLHLLHLEVLACTAQDTSGCRQKEEPGRGVELLCDHLDRILVPIVLCQMSLREESLQCPCDQCRGAAQATQRLQESSKLTVLLEAGSFTFLGCCLEQALTACGTEHADSSTADCKWLQAARAAECLAVLGAYARLQENRFLYHVPEGVAIALATLMRDSFAQGNPHAAVLARSLHILRNIAGNQEQVMVVSAEAFAECSRRLLEDLQAASVLASEGMGDAGVPSQPRPSSSAVASFFGNPQESDEFNGSAEVRSPNAEKAIFFAKKAAVRTKLRCDEIVLLVSLVLQALFQSDEALQQGDFVSEAALRQQMVSMASGLRSMLLQTNLSRLAFQSVRLYLLVCRSSHLRRQYAQVDPDFVEEERRAVAFFSSLSSSQHCFVLRAMAQDVQGWLLWQSQAFEKQRKTVVTFGGEETRKRRSSKRSKSSRSRDAGSSAAGDKVCNDARTAPAHESASPDVLQEQDETETKTHPETESVSLFTNGEAVWMVHALLVLAIAVCLMAYWSSLEETPASQAALARNGGRVLGGYRLYWR